MKIMLITALYFPARSPNVYRWSAIAHHWAKQGHDVHLLCTRFGKEPLEEKKEGISIHRTGHHTLLDWLHNFINLNTNRRGTLGAGKPKASFIRRMAEVFVNLTWRNIYFPDGSCIWYFPAKRRALELMRQHRFDAMISVSLPFTAALIASAVKKKHPTVRWLMDIEDPFAFVEEYFINNHTLYKTLNFKVEEKTLRLADTVSVTVEAACKKYAAVFPAVAEKLTVVPPLFDAPNVGRVQNPADVDVQQSTIINHQSSISLGYFGTFYPNIRSPEGLLRLVSEALKLEPELRHRLILHFAGEIPVEFADSFNAFPELTGNLRFLGLISREDVASLMQQVDFLVNVGNATDYHLPSKSAEYLMSGKPIINVACSPGDSFAHFLSEYQLILNLGLTGHRVSPEQVQAFLTFLKREKGKKVRREILEKLGKEFSLESVAGKYLKLISR